jgi:hypothetical protein
MGWSCSLGGKCNKCIQNSGWEICRKLYTLVTKKEMGGVY